MKRILGLDLEITAIVWWYVLRYYKKSTITRWTKITTAYSLVVKSLSHYYLEAQCECSWSAT